MELVVELVPRPLGGEPSPTYAQIPVGPDPQQVYAEYNNKCETCSIEGKFECDERWEYGDANLIQHLAGFIALCPSCHGIKHFGHAKLRNPEGRLGRLRDTWLTTREAS